VKAGTGTLDALKLAVSFMTSLASACLRSRILRRSDIMALAEPPHSLLAAFLGSNNVHLD